MNSIDYFKLIADMPIAYAFHKMLFNDKDEAIDYEFLEVNTAFEEITGLSAQALVGKTLLEVMPQSEIFWIQKYAECVQTGERIYFENYSSLLNKYFQVIAYSPSPNHFITLFLDITDRKEEYRKSVDTALFYQTITKNATDGVVILDKNKKYSYVSTNCYTMFGYVHSEILVFNTSDLTHPDDLVKLEFEFQKALLDPSYQPTIEHRFRSKSGGWVWLESKFTNLYDFPPVNGFLVNFKDITERRLKERKIKKSEALLAATLKHSRFSIWSVDLDYKLIYINDKFKQEFFGIFGIEICVGMRLIDYLPDNLVSVWVDRYKRVFNKVSLVECDTIEIGEYKVVVEISSTSIIVDGEVVGASFYGENISERKYYEDKLVESTQNLKSLLHASNHFVSSKPNDVKFNEIINVLCHISGAQFVVFNRLFDTYSHTLSICGLQDSKEIIQSYFNIDLLTHKWKRDSAFDLQWINNKITVLPDLGSIVVSNFKSSAIQFINDKFNLGNIVIVRIDGSEKVVGNFIFILEKGCSIKNTELIEMFSFQLGQYIERLNAEDELTKKMSEMERFHKLTVNREINMIELKKEVNELLKMLGRNEKYKIVSQ